MKIALPYIQLFDEDLTSDDFKIYGGVEKHVRKVYENFNCVVFQKHKSEMSNFHQVKREFQQFLAKEKPDLVYTNYGQKSFIVDGYPTIMHWHNTETGGFVHMNLVHLYNQRPDIFFMGVSEYQRKTYCKLSQRLIGKDIEFDRILPSGFLDAIIEVQNPEYDLITIGRLETQKDPLFITKLEDEFMNGRIFTTSLEAETARMKDADKKKLTNYYKKNAPAIFDHYQGLPHHEIMDHLSKAAVLVSTCPFESFGITVLEALSRGVPCILVSKGDMGHASASIAKDQNHIRIVDHKADPKEFRKAFFELLSLDRNEIAIATQSIHMKEYWVADYANAFSDAINKHSEQTNTLEAFI